MFKIITKKEYNHLNEVIDDYANHISKQSELIKKQNILLDVYKERIDKKIKSIDALAIQVEQLRKQLLILTPNRDAETGRFIPKYNSKKNEKKQVQQ